MQLFLHFTGPCTILIQSRGSGLRDVLTTRDVNEIADSPAGSVPQAVSLRSSQTSSTSTDGKVVPPAGAEAALPTLSYATVGRGGTVKFDEVKEKE